jgi:hypothetical protein
MLSCPTIADWSGMVKLHGRNGLLQVMASLLWWGEAVAKNSPLQRADWTMAVGDVDWVLQEMARPGVIKKGSVVAFVWFQRTNLMYNLSVGQKGGKNGGNTTKRKAVEV